MVVANHRRLIRIGLEFIDTVTRPKRSICEINNAENKSVNWQFLQTLETDPRTVDCKRYLCSQANICDTFALVLPSHFCIKCRKALRYSQLSVLFPQIIDFLYRTKTNKNVPE
jgi:hypothetical protein